MTPPKSKITADGIALVPHCPLPPDLSAVLPWDSIKAWG
jgi:hypothetical protein